LGIEKGKIEAQLLKTTKRIQRMREREEEEEEDIC
jgi:hypothetical protein